MLSDKMEKALNGQLNSEFYSAYLYLSMSAYFEAAGLKGFASWMRVQVQEETIHSMKFFDHISERRGKVKLGAVEAPPVEWDSPTAAFEHALQHEQKVTGLINDLVNLANAENDHASVNFLQWFVSEQVEEEASVDDVLQRIKLVENAPGGLFMIDAELGQRVFTPPASTGEGSGAE